MQHSQELAKLVGSPPGYLGHRESQPLLSQEALNRHHTENVKLSFVLFDEIEKGPRSLHRQLEATGQLDHPLTEGEIAQMRDYRVLVPWRAN